MIHSPPPIICQNYRFKEIIDPVITKRIDLSLCTLLLDGTPLKNSCSIPKFTFIFDYINPQQKMRVLLTETKKQKQNKN